MKIAPMAGVLLVLVGGHYIYQKYQIIEADQLSQVSQNEVKGTGHGPDAPVKKIPTPMPSTGPGDSSKIIPNDDTTPYRDIDRLKEQNSVEAVDSLLDISIIRIIGLKLMLLRLFERSVLPALCHVL